MKHDDPAHFGANHMPAEMASKLLGEAHQLAEADASPAQDECARLIAEEGIELAHVALKIPRFGVRVNPHDGRHATARLAEEIGHLLAAIDLAEIHGLIDRETIAAAHIRKLKEYRAGGLLKHARMP